MQKLHCFVVKIILKNNSELKDNIFFCFGRMPVKSYLNFIYFIEYVVCMLVVTNKFFFEIV